MQTVATRIESVGCAWEKPALKRLASAVRFRPWPPFINSLKTGIRVRHARLSSLSWAAESEKYSQNSGKRTFMSFQRRFLFGCVQKDLEDNQRCFLRERRGRETLSGLPGRQ